ncbi:PQQ-dependent sugar dehydrogenase [Algihabitans albus]|uniref:PQQ-dependent sugar dehydrogenase n=1 Tax=Algihabitans albus TaxID=2164067 RepID=UPI000E5CFA9F|nr:PQQ-dependent sugar dehydrogenase [Algihabitans albus]
MKMTGSLFGTAAAIALSAPILAATAQATVVVSEGEVPQIDDLRTSTVVSDLEHPWGMAWLPDGTILVTERPGRLRMIRDGALVEAEISGVPEVFAEGQGGLLDVAVHPDFSENRLIYLTYAQGTPDDNRTLIARAVLDDEALLDLEVIFEVEEQKPDTQHFGARLLWLPDGTLLASIGDGGNPPVEIEGELIRLRAQEVSSAFGKILRLNDDGSAPEDNPFLDGEGVAPFVWSYGHRNVQGMAIDPETGAVWVNEHGALAGDELNSIVRGANYGWPAATYSKDYAGATEISPHTSLPDMADPVLVWMDTQAPSGLVVYSGDVFPDWQGHLLSGSLAVGEIRKISLDDTNAVREEMSIPIGARVRDVRQGPDGHLYVLTDEEEGALLRIEPAS